MAVSSTSTPRGKLLQRSTFWILGLFVLILAGNWAAAVARFQVNVPMWDQWDFLNPLFNEEGVAALFQLQHGPHRQGVGFVFTSWIMALSDWDSRVESLWMVFLLATTAILALWLKYRLCARLTLTDLVIPLLVFALAQWGSVIAVPNASHSVFPLFLILLSAHCWLGIRPALRLPLAGLLATGCTFTGFGIFAGLLLTMLLAGTTIRALAAKDTRETIPAAIGLAIALTGWFAFSRGYRFDPASAGYRFPHEPVSEYFHFIALMLAHPAGPESATSPAYWLGGTLMMLALTIFAQVLWRRFFSAGDRRSEEVVLLLMGAGLAFAAFTAVGRIHLGMTAGMVSRYVTLLIPLWLGIYLWGALQRRPALRWISIVPVACVAVLPFASLSQRPLRNWIGTAGLTHASLQSLARSTSEKMAWVSSYLRQEDRAYADRFAGRLVHPTGESNGLDRKLLWLKQRQLSFFKNVNEGNRWQPWREETRCLWLRAHAPEFDGYWMAGDSTLWIHSARDGFINLEVIQQAAGLPAGASLEFQYRGATGREKAAFLNEIISLPVSRGEHTIAVRSTTGSVAANPPRDNRPVSYKLGHAFVTARSAGVEWTRSDDAASEWRPGRRWRILNGFHGWERPADFGWTDASLNIEIYTVTDAYLNVDIQKRYKPVDFGSILVGVGEAVFELDPEGFPSAFSLRIPAGDFARQVSIVNGGGAGSPRRMEGKVDERSLSLRLGHLSTSIEPRFPVINARRPGSEGGTGR